MDGEEIAKFVETVENLCANTYILDNCDCKFKPITPHTEGLGLLPHPQKNLKTYMQICAL